MTRALAVLLAAALVGAVLGALAVLLRTPLWLALPLAALAAFGLARRWS